MSSGSERFTPKRAIVLSAGIGKRMRPITATTPKPLIEVAGKALIDYGLDRLEQLGVKEVVVNVHYLADLVEVHATRRAGPQVIISDERDQLLETGGGVKKALPLLGDEPFLVLNSDTTWVEGARENLRLLCDAWDPDQMDILMLIASTVSSTGYSGSGDFDMDQMGRLSRRAAPRVASFVYAGALIVKPSLFERTPEGSFSLNLLFDRAIEQGRLFGVRLDGFWLHVGTPEAISEAEEAIDRSLM